LEPDGEKRKLGDDAILFANIGKGLSLKIADFFVV
jgi:hypothetical protein